MLGMIKVSINKSYHCKPFHINSTPRVLRFLASSRYHLIYFSYLYNLYEIPSLLIILWEQTAKQADLFADFIGHKK